MARATTAGDSARRYHSEPPNQSYRGSQMSITSLLPMWIYVYCIVLHKNAKAPYLVCVEVCSQPFRTQGPRIEREMPFLLGDLLYEAPRGRYKGCKGEDNTSFL